MSLKASTKLVVIQLVIRFSNKLPRFFARIFANAIWQFAGEVMNLYYCCLVLLRIEPKMWLKQYVKKLAT
jgi:hypothetical protein